MPVPDTSSAVPAAAAGIGLKPDHFRSVLEAKTDGLWVEVHPENYMEEGGPRLNWLEAIRKDKPVSFHGVGMSLGGFEPLDPDHLKRWKALVERFEPIRVSEHLAWSAHAGTYFNDLLPTPMTQAALDHFCAHVDAMQSALGRQVLVENPSRYLPMHDDIPEVDFLAETVRRTGCGLLLDVNNVFVSAHNLGFDARAYLDAVPAEAIGEIHLAGHEEDQALGGELLVDTHGAPVTGDVWALYRYLIERVGPRPTLIEHDTNLPAFEALMAERDAAQAILDAHRIREGAHV
ncbi:DUF692 domain-containing protein [Maricaulis sp.]|uniref:MNIO family bufferin maturase n=1 Tax=Maricaulis sp. TaxID=1486257 RepID=UPI00262D56AE|nr:DUF692 domain-containing protein [Maricaulis sp.]